MASSAKCGWEQYSCNQPVLDCFERLAGDDAVCANQEQEAERQDAGAYRRKQKVPRRNDDAFFRGGGVDAMPALMSRTGSLSTSNVSAHVLVTCLHSALLSNAVLLRALTELHHDALLSYAETTAVSDAHMHFSADAARQRLGEQAHAADRALAAVMDYLEILK